MVTTKDEKQEEKEEVSLTTITKPRRVNYESDRIIDADCSNHITGDIKKLEDLEKYKRRHVILTANSSKLPITHACKTIIFPGFSLE